MHKNRLAAFGLVAGLFGGAAAGMAFGVPGFAGAQTDDRRVTTEQRGQWLSDALAPLVSEGTITQAQADAVIAAVEAARPAHGPHFGFRFGGGPAKLEAAAGAIGITAEELRSALEGGQSLAEVAQSKGVDPEEVVAALVAEIQARIAEKVSSGRITQEQADALLADVTDRIRAFVNGEAPPPGRHRGPHGFRGPGRGPAPANMPAESAISA